jgi:hypothetical protein
MVRNEVQSLVKLFPKLTATELWEVFKAWTRAGREGKGWYKL